MSLLSTIIDDPPGPLLIFQSSSAQSSLPVLRRLLSQSITSASQSHFLLYFLLYPPTALLEDPASDHDHLKIHNWLGRVREYEDEWIDEREQILSAIKNASSGPLYVVIDSVNTLSSQVGSVSETYEFLLTLLLLVRSRSSPSYLILHATQPLGLLSLFTQSAFSPSLTYLIAHPPILLTHLAKDYLTPPPPATPAAKFWGVFLPVSERVHDTDRLVFGSDGEGTGGTLEIVVEILIRGVGGPNRRRRAERVLEGWSCVKAAPCEMAALESLKSLWPKKTADEVAPDPTQSVSFNLNLTTSQQQSRAQVPLPYAHEGKQLINVASSIFYDPDSADDIDDDDPDEDLDI